MDKKDFNCNMTFETGLDHCKGCKQYFVSEVKDFDFELCSFYGQVKENDMEDYKVFSGVVFVFRNPKHRNKEFSVTGWHKDHDKRVMDAMYKSFKEFGICDSLKEHRENWGSEDYEIEGVFTIPIDLIIPLTEEEAEHVTPLGRLYPLCENEEDTVPMEGQISLEEIQ